MCSFFLFFFVCVQKSSDTGVVATPVVSDLNRLKLDTPPGLPLRITSESWMALRPSSRVASSCCLDSS